MGGRTEGGLKLNPLADVFQYDSATGEWHSKAPLPEARGRLACSVVDGIIYVTGGENYVAYADDVLAYDPAQDTWTVKRTMFIGRGPNASTALDGKIYVVRNIPDEGIDNFFVYEPTENTLEPLAPLPPASTSGALAAASGKVYALGGHDGTAATAAVLQYDPAADTWSPRAAMKTARAYATAVALGGRLYVVGGATGTSNSSVVEEYDPVSDSWTTKTSANVARASATGAALGDRAYVIGGYGRPNATESEAVLPLVETYDPTRDP